MVRGNQNSLNAILPQELFIPCGLEGWAIVADYLGRETVSCQNIAHGINGCVGCCCLHGIDHFRALRVDVDHNENVFCLMGGKIYTWMRCHGAVGQGHARSVENGGALRVLLHGWHSQITFSISWSICGHHTWLRAIYFMRAISGWTSCNSVRMSCLKEGGMTVRRAHIRQPCAPESSCLRVKYGLRSVMNRPTF